MAEPSKTLQPPHVDGFKIAGSVKGTLKRVAELVSEISFLEVALEKEAVNLAYVESRDINKQPYLFSIMKFKDDGVDVLYSVPAEIAPRKRRMDVIRYLLNILTLIEKEYVVENKVIYQLIESSLKELTESTNIEYSKLYTAYDNLKKDNEQLQRRIDRLEEQVSNLNTKNYDLQGKNDEFTLRLKQLESMPAGILKAKIQEWITEHNGEISVFEFSKVYRVNEALVEEALNQLVNEGYLERSR